MPATRKLLGGPLVHGTDVRTNGTLFRSIDACLGVDGLPQSATGQTSLFTGVNAPALVGAHTGPYPAEALRQIIAERSILKQVVDSGLTATFANAYSEQYWQRAEQGRARHSASTLCTMAAGLPFRTMDDLRQGTAIYWDITHEVMRTLFGADIPLRSPHESGRHLASLCESHDLVVFESFLTDLAGHGRLPWPAAVLLEMLDDFLAGILSALPEGSSLVLSSDHGNLEDSSSRMHTRNPVPLLVIGPAAQAFRPAQNITHVTPAILSWLGAT